MRIMASSPITSWEIDGETLETVSDFISWGSKITADGDCSHGIKRHLLLGRKVTLDSISTSLMAQRLKRLPTMCRRPGFDPWVRKIPWRRKWQSTPVFLPGESHGWRSPWGRKESDTTEQLHLNLNYCIKPLSFWVICYAAIHDYYSQVRR